MSPRLTLVMPLRGRNLFTLRLLYHADRMRMPYRFLIADGLVHPKLAEILENSRRHFPNLDIEYVRYPDDRDFSFYFNKVADAVSRVTTPYAMQVDNDDFLTMSGLEKALDFLDANPDYIGCSGRILRFSVREKKAPISDGLTGTLNRISTYFRLTTGDDASMMQRFRNTLFSLWPFYAVLRAEVLAQVCREIAEISFSDLQIHESYHVMRALTLGKIKMDGSRVSYIRQAGTSLNSSYKKDWVHHLVRSRFTTDIDAFVERISQGAIAAGADPATVREELYDLLDIKFRQLVRATYGSLQEVKGILRRKAPGLVRWFKARPNLRLGRDEAAMVNDLRAHGASDADIAAYHAEIRALREVLAGPAFEAFIRPLAPTFAAADATHRKASNVE